MERDLRPAAPRFTSALRALAACSLALLLGAALPAAAEPDPCPAQPEWEWDEPDAVNPGLGTWR
jgi:hypothetical protein